MNILFFVLSAIHIQTDWVGGDSIQGPVANWGTSFYSYDSVTYNIQGQVCPVASQVDYASWTRHVIDSTNKIGCHSIWPADFDNDGDIDLAGWQGAGNLLVFYRNNGDGTFTKMTTYPVLGASDWGFLSGNDMDNDGLLDVVVPGGTDDGGNNPTGLVWYKNNGSFNFTRTIIDSSGTINPYFCVETGDIDKDGDMDILAGCVMNMTTHIYTNNGSGVFSRTGTVSDKAWRLRLDDMDKDGDNDLLMVPFSAGSEISVWFNNGVGQFSKVTTLSGTDDADGVWSRDFDNDGDEDILGTRSNSSRDDFYWFENLGTGTTYTRHNVYSAAQDNSFGDGACAEDIDLDGKTDIISGYGEIGFFRQVNPDSFTTYKIDNYKPMGLATHWVIPAKLKPGCIGGGWDILVCRELAFLWYENKMIEAFSTGWLQSSILELDTANRSVQSFGWKACLPETSTIAFYWRGDSILSDLIAKPWEGPFYARNAEDSFDISVTPCHRYFQYKANFLKTTSTVDAPVLKEVWLRDTVCLAGGVEEKTITKNPIELRTTGNNVLLSSPVQIEKASLSIYNITGELVQTIYQGRVEAKNYTFTPQLKTKGIYLVVLKWNEGTKTAKLVKYR
ncbi:MAG: T9SS type A sorting domain-containing protein [bacterium]|nr:T9SS type A sorting domain-containing protein [bacterium]